MTKHLPVLIVAAAFLIAGIALGRSCGGGRDLKDKLKQYEAKRIDNEKKIEELGLAIKEKEREAEKLKAERNGYMDSTATLIADRESAIRNKDKRIEELEHAQAGMTDWEDKYENEHAQKLEWIEKFDLERSKVEEVGYPSLVDGEYVFPEGSLVFNLVQSYEKSLASKDEIILGMKRQLEAEHSLRLAAEKLYGDYRKELRSVKLRSSIKTIASAALAGAVLYLAIQ